MINTPKKNFKRVISIFTMLVILLICFFSGCSNDDDIEIILVPSGFSVTFIDVGNGDCIFINFGDGKNMLIDCGLDTQANYDNITNVLDAHNVHSIDYLVLTHPDVDHIGNASKIILKYPVKKAFIPNVYNKEPYETFKKVYELLVSLKVEINYSNYFTNISGDNYFLAFLSPCSSMIGSYYGEFNGIVNPTDKDINDLSPIIYLDYNGVRFLFTGDAGVKQEKLLIEKYKVGLYDQIHDVDVNLYDIDLLKASHHGSEDSSGLEFLTMLRPKYAVFSVGGNNVYGHPSARVINNLYHVNSTVKILRTDVLGSICITVTKDGKLKVLE